MNPRISAIWLTCKHSVRTANALLIVVMLVLGLALYGPYLDNPWVFDDVNVFHTSVLTQAAIAPWEIGIRGLPYFTLGWVQTQIGSMTAHRLVSLGLHLCTAYQLYRFLEAALDFESEAFHGHTPAEKMARIRWTAAIVSLVFVVHPVAVYGAGYLVQRTSVMATFFTLLCLRLLLQALQQSTWQLAIGAAVWASLAILSKEHAVGVPLFALSLLILFGPLERGRIGVAVLFLTLSIPAMALAFHTGGHTIGQAYEPAVNEHDFWLGMPFSFSNPYERWLFSASNQAQLYFEYWFQWLFPQTSRMSADLRVDFGKTWNPAAAWGRLLAFALIPVTAAVAATRMPRYRLLAFALIFNGGLFIVELGTVRLQEPYVLYRSYLWAIGYGVAVASVVLRLPPRVALATAILAIALLFAQAGNRLDTLRSSLALWEDAAAKLYSPSVAGAGRIFFNRGGERFKRGNIQSAMTDIDWAIELNPNNGRYRIARAAALLRLNRPFDALKDLQTAESLLPTDGHLWFSKFRVLQALHRTNEAEAALQRAAQLGNYGARFELSRRKSRNGEITVELDTSP